VAAAHAVLGRIQARQGEPGGRPALDTAARLSDGASLVDRRFPICAAAWRELGCPYEEALALADGDPVAQLAALKILDRLGARPAAAWVRARLREAGVTGIPGGRGRRPGRTRPG
jgi:hypothetical protein